MSYKFNVFTGKLDLVGGASNNFSFIRVAPSTTVIVPVGQQMLFSGPLRVDGSLRVLGEIREVTPQESFDGWRVIGVEKTVVIPQNRQQLFTSGMRVLGILRVRGELKEVA